MDFDPDSYEKIGFDAILPAKELISRIKSINKEYFCPLIALIIGCLSRRKIPLVMDIGCGPGNTAKMLAQELTPDRIVGVDIDRQMIEFAKQNNAMPNTEYLCQDVSRHWSEWEEELRKLAGKVSVIFSNYALHWVKDVEQTASNLAKLLAPNGHIVVDILYVGDIYHNLRPEERLKYEQWIAYPSEEQVVGRWMTAFKKAGLNRMETKSWLPRCIYPQRVYFEEFIKWPIDWYKSYLKTGAEPDVDIDELLKGLIIKKRVRKMTEKSIKGEELIEITQELWNFVVSR